MAPEYSKIIPTKPGHYVYRLWAADGTPLYAGCAGERTPRRVTDRLWDHRRKPWWSEVDEARTDVATFSNADEVIKEETRQIASLSPKYNKYLLGRCTKGHDISAPGTRRADGSCKECFTEYQAAYRARPAVKMRKAAWSRAYGADPVVKAQAAARGRAARRRPGPSQEGLWA